MLRTENCRCRIILLICVATICKNYFETTRCYNTLRSPSCICTSTISITLIHKSTTSCRLLSPRPRRHDVTGSSSLRRIKKRAGTDQLVTSRWRHSRRVAERWRNLTWRDSRCADDVVVTRDFYQGQEQGHVQVQPNKNTSIFRISVISSSSFNLS